MESNHRPSGYEPDELPLLYPAIANAKVRTIFDSANFFCKKYVLQHNFFDFLSNSGDFGVEKGAIFDFKR